MGGRPSTKFTEKEKKKRGYWKEKTAKMEKRGSGENSGTKKGVEDRENVNGGNNRVQKRSRVPHLRGLQTGEGARANAQKKQTRTISGKPRNRKTFSSRRNFKEEN